MEDEGSTDEPVASEIRATLEAHGGNVVRTAQALGLSRYVLYRLMRKHGIGARNGGQ
jgi:transcriptional regulator of acetoin/glycerol metabolism